MLQTAPVLTQQKQKYCLWTYFSTFLGAITFSNEENSLEIDTLGHIVQVFSLVFITTFKWVIYLIQPLVALMISIYVENYTVVLVVPAVIIFIFSFILNIMSIQKNNQRKNAVYNKNILELYAQESILQKLIKPKTQICEFLITILLTPVFTVLLSSSYYFNIKNQSNGFLPFLFISSCSVFQSLLNTNPTEPGTFSSQNSQLQFYSTVMSRALYGCTMLLLVFIGNHTGINALSLTFNIIFIIQPFLLFLGIFGSFGAFVEYVFEQFNIIMCGGTGGSCFFRTAVHFSLNIIICLISAEIQDRSLKGSIIFLGIFSLRSKFNFLGTLGIEQKKSYDILIRSSNRQTFLFKVMNFQKTNILFSFATAFIEFLAIIVITLQLDKDISAILGITCLVHFAILWFLTQLQKRIFIGLFRSPFVKHAKLQITTNTMKQLQQILQAIFLSATYNQMSFEHQIYSVRFLISLLIQKNFQLSHTNINMLNCCELVAFLYRQDQNLANNLIYTSVITHIILRAGIKLFKRTQIWLFAFAKMLTEKKQRVNKALILLLLQLTLLLPISLFMLILSSILDVPYIPYLGLPIFTCASLRPIRNWPALQRGQKGSSEAGVYNFFTMVSVDQLQAVLQRGQVSLIAGQYFLLRISKYIATLQIIESGGTYLLVSLVGLESQETTSCHGVEAREIDRMLAEYFDAPQVDGGVVVKKNIHYDCCGSVTPFSSFQTTTYEENQIKLTGIIESEDFLSGFKQIFLRGICHYSSIIDELDKKMILHISENLFPQVFIDSKDVEKALIYFPEKYSQLEGLKERFDMSANTNDEESNKYSGKRTKQKILDIPTVQQDNNIDDLGLFLNEIEEPRQKQQIQKSDYKPVRAKDDDDLFGMLDDLVQEVPKVAPKKNISQPLHIGKILGGEKQTSYESLYYHFKRTVMYLYVIAFNDSEIQLSQRVNNQNLFKLFKDKNYISSMRQFKGSDNFEKIYQIILNSIRSSIKIALEIYTVEGTFESMNDEEIKEQFESQQKECYIGMGNEEKWYQKLINNQLIRFENMKNSIGSLWSMGFLNSQNSIILYRFTLSLIDCYLFELNEEVVRGIHGNLQFELQFVTNDDDERYSIQTHQQFLRNIIIESAQEPLGYATFYSGNIILSL